MFDLPEACPREGHMAGKPSPAPTAVRRSAPCVSHSTTAPPTSAGRPRPTVRRARARSEQAVELGRRCRTHAGRPVVVGPVDLIQCGRGSAGVDVVAVVDRRPAEIHFSALGHDVDGGARQPPGDGRDRCGGRGGEGVVDGEPSAAHLAFTAARAHGPAVGNRLPEVLLVGQPHQPGTQPFPPVPVQLVAEFVGPVSPCTWVGCRSVPSESRQFRVVVRRHARTSNMRLFTVHVRLPATQATGPRAPSSRKTQRKNRLEW
ncbi:hypothetical protein SNOUR_09855 [Streptomyces noursei ATCC 11455]|nr:hypothetical protein SNOUR_09855 [Streptomyces noursei ATCC 11455]